jgi:class 3 adenylate cyclase
MPVMPLKEELESECREIFRAQWKTRVGVKIPAAEEILLGNQAVELDAVVLYADLTESTKLVDQHNWEFAGEVYKTFLRCSARIIKSMEGEVTAYDGDRVMGIFIGSYKNSNAIKAALKINAARIFILQPAIKDLGKDYTVKHTVGIDASTIRAARTGVRGANDIVWIGKAANWAAKLCSVDNSYPTWITESVYKNCIEECRTTKGNSMWEARQWTAMNNALVYRSNWHWNI